MSSITQGFPRLNGALDPNTLAQPTITAPINQQVIDPTKTLGIRANGSPAAGAAPFGGIQMSDLPNPVPTVSRGGASGDWVNAPSPAPVANPVAVTPAPTPAPTPTPRQTTAANPAPAAAPGNGYDGQPVDVIRGLRVTQELPLFDDAGRSRAGAAPGRGVPGAGGAIESAFDRQLQMNQAMLDRAIDYVQGGGNIFEQATRTKLMAPLIGQIINGNDLGRSLTGNLNTQTNAAASVTGAGIGAAASRYGSDQRLAGDQAQVGERMYEAQTSSVPTGTALQPDPVTGLAVPVTTYGQRPAAAGAMPIPYAQPKPNQPAEGATGTSNGKPVVYVKGQWVPR